MYATHQNALTKDNQVSLPSSAQKKSFPEISPESFIAHYSNNYIILPIFKKYNNFFAWINFPQTMSINIFN